MFSAQDVMDVMHAKWLRRMIWKDAASLIFAATDSFVIGGLDAILPVQSGEPWQERSYHFSEDTWPSGRNHNGTLH